MRSSNREAVCNNIQELDSGTSRRTKQMPTQHKCQRGQSSSNFGLTSSIITRNGVPGHCWLVSTSTSNAGVSSPHFTFGPPARLIARKVKQSVPWTTYADWVVLRKGLDYPSPPTAIGEPDELRAEVRLHYTPDTHKEKHGKGEA